MSFHWQRGQYDNVLVACLEGLVTDEELRRRLLQHFYNLRHSNGGYVPVDDMIISGTEPVARGVIAGVCRQLAEGGYIEWTEFLEPGHTIGSARIKNPGIKAVERGGSPGINIRFSNKEIETTSVKRAPRDEEWMSAKEALDYLLYRGMSYFEARSTIFDRAHEGLIEARAKRINVGGEQFDDDEVPPDFWASNELTEKWEAGDFATAYDYSSPIKAFGVRFRRQDIEQLIPPTAESPAARRTPAQKARRTVFIGHGHSEEWRKLAMFLRDDHGLTVIEFNSSSPAGISTTDHIQKMLDQANFAFLILTGEDEQATGEFNPRLNVVHEAGLFQGKLGFRKAILLLEEGMPRVFKRPRAHSYSVPKGEDRSAIP